MDDKTEKSDEKVVGFANMLKNLSGGEDFKDKLILELIKSKDEFQNNFIKLFKDRLNEIYPDRHYDIEEKRVDNEHVREMLRIKMDMDKAEEERKLVRVEMVKDYEREMYDTNLSILTGLFGFETKTKKLTAKLLAKNEARDFEAKLKATESDVLALPHNNKKLLD